MTVYVQKMDEAAWREDAPRSIGDAVQGLRTFRLDELVPFLPPMEPAQLLSLRRAVVSGGLSGLQVWGLPAGADGIPPLSRDALLLQEGDVIRYAGRVLHHFPDPCRELSEHLWGSIPFGSIMLLAGSLARYPWSRLADELGFDRDDPQRRHVLRLTPARLALSPFRSSGQLLEALGSGGLVGSALQSSGVLGFAEAQEGFGGGVDESTFDEAVTLRGGGCCTLCDLDVAPALRAVRLIPLEDGGSDEPGNGLLMCATHAAMFEAGLFRIRPGDLALVPTPPYDLAGLRIVHADLDHLVQPPHAEALAWRWEQPLDPAA